jgi:hypothetical protein
MFPKLERDIIETIYTSNGCDTELTIGILLEISGEGQVVTYSFMNEARSSHRSLQVQSDEEYARKLQEQELKQSNSERERDSEVDISIKDEIQVIGESIKKGFQNLKRFVGKVSNQILSPTEIAPRSHYNNLPNNEFTKFLEDDQLEITPARRNIHERIQMKQGEEAI